MRSHRTETTVSCPERFFQSTLHLAGCVTEWGRKDWYLTVFKNDKLSPRKATPVQGQWEVAELDLINDNHDKKVK